MSADTVVEVRVQRVFIYKNGSVIFIEDGKKTSFFSAGVFEGIILRHVLAKGQSERPLTHATWIASLARCGHLPTRAIITKIMRGIFYGELTLARDIDYTGPDLVVDCRPSDMLIIATLANIPIHVAQDVWDAMKDCGDKVTTLSDEEFKKTWPISNFVNPPIFYLGMTVDEIAEFEKGQQ